MKLYAARLDFRAIAEEFNVPTDFPPEIVQAAEEATDRFADQRTDHRDKPFVTIDPAGSMDLDQAVYIVAKDQAQDQGQEQGSGFTVYYAIADVAAFIEPGSALEDESIRRGQTIYLPDEPARLHPTALSEDSASLLPDVDRPAVVWTIHLDNDGEVTSFAVERGTIHSVARLDYDGVQADLEAGRMHPSIALLPDVGRLRQASALRRQAINLRLPAQSVAEREDGTFELVVEPRHDVMDWNSEISLLTGMCAGQLMEEKGHGFLRTLRPATEESTSEFRGAAQALGFEPPEPDRIGEFLQSIDAASPQGMAIMREAAKLLRGSGYALVQTDGAEVHNGVGGFYAHVTAPLRRLVDRYATECCLALSAGTEIPSWVDARADGIVEAMKASSSLASTVERACLGLTEATVLQPYAGENFEAVVLSSNPEGNSARIFIETPPVLDDTEGSPETASTTPVTLTEADIAKRSVTFAWPARGESTPGVNKP